MERENKMKTQTITVGNAGTGGYWFTVDGETHGGFDTEANATDTAIRFCQEQGWLYEIYYECWSGTIGRTVSIPGSISLELGF